MCNPACCGFCAGISFFGSFFMFLIGGLIQNNYKYVGDWYHKEIDPVTHKVRGDPTQAQIDAASHSCYVTAAVYLGFAIFATICICVQHARRKRN